MCLSDLQKGSAEVGVSLRRLCKVEKKWGWPLSN